MKTAPPNTTESVGSSVKILRNALSPYTHNDYRREN